MLANGIFFKKIGLPPEAGFVALLNYRATAFPFLFSVISMVGKIHVDYDMISPFPCTKCEGGKMFTQPARAPIFLR